MTVCIIVNEKISLMLHMTLTFIQCQSCPRYSCILHSCDYQGVLQLSCSQTNGRQTERQTRSYTIAVMTKCSNNETDKL